MWLLLFARGASWSLSPLGVLDLPLDDAPNGTNATQVSAHVDEEASFAELEDDMVSRTPSPEPTRRAVAPGGAASTFRVAGKLHDASVAVDEELPADRPEPGSLEQVAALGAARAMVERKLGRVGARLEERGALREGGEALAAAQQELLDAHGALAQLEGAYKLEASVEPGAAHSFVATKQPEQELVARALAHARSALDRTDAQLVLEPDEPEVEAATTPRAPRHWIAPLEEEGVRLALLSEPHERGPPAVPKARPVAVLYDAIVARLPTLALPALPKDSLLEHWASGRARAPSGMSPATKVAVVVGLLLAGIAAVIFYRFWRGAKEADMSVPLVFGQARSDRRDSSASDGGTPRTRRGCSVAFADRDVGKLVLLMDEDAPIGQLPTQLHPWAAPPVTTGALAGTYLASMIAEDRELYIDDILESGGLGKLVGFLSGSTDRQHAAISALSVLSEDTSCAESMLETDAVEQLGQLLTVGGPWPRSSTSLALRNLFITEPAKKHAFVERYGVQGFTVLLKEAEVEIQLDALLTLLDVIEDETHAGEEDALAADPQILAAIKRFDGPWIYERLKFLAESHHDDISQHAQDLLLALQETPR